MPVLVAARDGSLVPLGDPTGPPPPELATTLIGYVPTGTAGDGGSPERIAAVENEIGPGRVIRLYETTVPAAWAGGAYDTVDSMGAAVLLSINVDYDTQLAGDMGDPAYVAALQQFAATIPQDRPIHLCTHHEWENDAVIDGPKDPTPWLTVHDRFYRIVKDAAPWVQVGPCHGSFSWKSGGRVDAMGGPAACTPQRFDFAAVDTYSLNQLPKALQDYPQHQRWHGWYALKGVPLQVWERGMDHTKSGQNADGTAVDDQAIAQAIYADETWMHEHGYTAVCWWQKPAGATELTQAVTPAAWAAWRAVAARGPVPGGS